MELLPELSTLALPLEAVNDSILKKIGEKGKFSSLRCLDIGKSDITDDGILGLLVESQFDELLLSGCLKITDSALVALARVPKKTLDTLDVSECSNITNYGVEKLCNHPLRKLTLKGCKGIKDGLDLSAFAMLEYLDIRKTGINREFAEKIQRKNPIITVIY